MSNYIDNNDNLIFDCNYINNKFNTNIGCYKYINKYKLFELINGHDDLYKIICYMKNCELKIRGNCGKFAVKYTTLNDNKFYILFDDEIKLYDKCNELIILDDKIGLYNIMKKIISNWGSINFYIMNYNNKNFNVFRSIKSIYYDKDMIYINRKLYKEQMNTILLFSTNYVNIIKTMKYKFGETFFFRIMSYIYHDYNKFFSFTTKTLLFKQFKFKNNITKNIGSSYTYEFDLYIKNRYHNNDILFFDTEVSFFSYKSRKPIGSDKKCRLLRYDYIIIPKRKDKYRIYLLEIQGEYHTLFDYTTDITKKCSCNATFSDHINNIKSHLTYNKNTIPLLELFDKDFKNNNWINIINNFENTLFKQSSHKIIITTKTSKNIKQKKIKFLVKKVNKLITKYHSNIPSIYIDKLFFSS
jgi:hypothetical protein